MAMTTIKVVRKEHRIVTPCIMLMINITLQSCINCVRISYLDSILFVGDEVDACLHSGISTLS